MKCSDGNICNPEREVTQNFELNYATIEGKTVEVTAQARGQMDAINRQLEKAKSIKNIVSSDRIQELPDANAAEAVARVPGVSIREVEKEIKWSSEACLSTTK